MFRKLLTKQTFSTLRRCHGERNLRRNYLTAAYKCEESWNKRLEEDLIKPIRANELYMELMQKHRKEGVIFAIDVDLFLNSLRCDGSNWIVEDIEDVLFKLRHTADTANTLHSSWHTTLRVLLQRNETQALFSMLTQPIEYGIYMDQLVSNIIMDHFLVKKDYTKCARAASRLMLAEDFGPRVNQLFVLLSSLRYALAPEGENVEWKNYEMVVEEPEETVLVRQDFKPNPYFDDHFDLRDPPLLVGKTLAWCSQHYFDGNVRDNCSLLGWAMYRKWDKLGDRVKKISAASQATAIDSNVVSLVQQQVTSHCPEEGEQQSALLAAVAGLQLSSSYDVAAEVEDSLQRQLAQDEQEHIAAQEKLYIEWAKIREMTVEEQLVEAKKKRLMQEIKEKKKYLKKEEQVLNFFDEEKKHELFLSTVGKFDHPFPRNNRHKVAGKRKEKVDDNYIPPMVR